MCRMYRKVHSESCLNFVINIILLLGVITTDLDSPLDTLISELPESS